MTEGAGQEKGGSVPYCSHHALQRITKDDFSTTLVTFQPLLSLPNHSRHSPTTSVTSQPLPSLLNPCHCRVLVSTQQSTIIRLHRNQLQFSPRSMSPEMETHLEKTTLLPTTSFKEFDYIAIFHKGIYRQEICGHKAGNTQVYSTTTSQIWKFMQ